MIAKLVELLDSIRPSLPVTVRGPRELIADRVPKIAPVLSRINSPSPATMADALAPSALTVPEFCTDTPKPEIALAPNDGSVASIVAPFALFTLAVLAA